MDPLKVGLIQHVEDEFGISVSDGEALQLRTAGELHVLLMQKLGRDDLLLLARALYQTRRVLADALAVPRRSITPRTQLAELVPPTDRAKRWNEIAVKAGAWFPPLIHSRRWQDRIMLASMALASIPVIALWSTLYTLDWIHGLWMVFFAFPAALAFLLIESRVDKHLLHATSRWAKELPCETVQELAQELIPRDASLANTRLLTLRKPLGDDVWARLAHAIRQSGGREFTIILPGTEIPELENIQQ